MVSTCANPECSAPFRHLKKGRVFLIDSRDYARGQEASSSSRLEYFWLCDACATRFKMAAGPGNRVACVSRADNQLNDLPGARPA
jgi:hypothetical protein